MRQDIKVNVGEFTTKVVFMQPQMSKNNRGAIENTWVELAPVYAKVEEMAAAEGMSNGNLIALDSLKITTWVIMNASTRWRVKYNNAEYDIVKVQRLFNQPIIEIIATKIIE